MPTWQSAGEPSARRSSAVKRPSPRRATSSEEDALDRVLGAEGEDLVQRRFDQRVPLIATLGSRRCRSTSAPSRASTRRPASSRATRCARKYIAETYFDNPVQRNGERGMLGYTGECEGKPVSVQATGMGCPSAAIVMEELVQLGVKRFLRVGTCGGLQQDLELGDLIVAVSAVPADGDGAALRRRRAALRRPPTGSSSTRAVHAAKELGQPLRVGAIASSDTFYDPDAGAAQALVGARRARRSRWRRRCCSRSARCAGVQAGCLLTVSDIVDRRGVHADLRRGAARPRSTG